MKCERCGNGMETANELSRGRHVKRVYICSMCGHTTRRNISTIPNKVGKRY